MAVDKRRFDEKVGKLRKQLPKIANELVADASVFLQNKLSDEILNGPSGSNYPKTGYAAAIAPGERGFVGVVSSQLRRSISVDLSKRFVGEVFVDAGLGSVGDYAGRMAEFTREKYGQDYLEIALTLYQEPIKESARKELARFVRSVSNNRPYRYKNPF